jgi:hypothetical protein
MRPKCVNPASGVHVSGPPFTKPQRDPEAFAAVPSSLPYLEAPVIFVAKTPESFEKFPEPNEPSASSTPAKSKFPVEVIRLCIAVDEKVPSSLEMSTFPPTSSKPTTAPRETLEKQAAATRQSGNEVELLNIRVISTIFERK